MSEYKKVVTKLESSVKPISINTQDAYEYAKLQNEANNIANNIQEEKVQDNIVEPIRTDEANLEEFHAVNDVIKITKKKTSLATYVIMVTVLIVLVAIFIIFELPMLRGL